MFSFRFLAWPSPWHYSSRFTGLAKNMMPKTSEALSHQPFCLIIKWTQRMTARSITPSPAEEIRPIDRSTSLLLVQLLSQLIWLFFSFCFTFAIYLPKRGETPQTNGFSTRNHRSALRMFLNLRKCFALLIHAICAKIMCVWHQGRILQSLPLGFQPLCLIYWKTRKSHSNWES